MNRYMKNNKDKRSKFIKHRDASHGTNQLAINNNAGSKLRHHKMNDQQESGIELP